MYWLIGLFDKETEDRIINMRKDIHSTLAIDDAAQPHLSFASYHELDIDSYVIMMDQFLTNSPSLAMNFQSVGAFMRFPALFLSPVMTKELIQFHFELYEIFKQFNYAANGHYMPGSWVPHCTMISHVPLERVAEAAAYCISTYKPFLGSLTEIALVIEDGELIHSVRLKSPPIT